MQVLLLGSSPLLMRPGLTESLFGGFEVLRLGHWSFDEMNEAFGVTLEQYLYFRQIAREAHVHGRRRLAGATTYVSLSSLPNIEKDVFEMFRVDKPALGGVCQPGLQLLGPDHGPGQGERPTRRPYPERSVISWHFYGPARTVDRIAQVSRANWFASASRRPSSWSTTPRSSTPWGATVSTRRAPTAAIGDASLESAVGAHLINTSDSETAVHYWRDGNDEVDFVLERRSRLAAIEEWKLRSEAIGHRGLDEFHRRHPEVRKVMVGGDRCRSASFCAVRATEWTR